MLHDEPSEVCLRLSFYPDVERKRLNLEQECSSRLRGAIAIRIECDTLYDF
jgi:hypothetical protein